MITKRHRRTTLGARGRVVAALGAAVLLLSGVAVATAAVSTAATSAPAGYSIWPDTIVPAVPVDSDTSSVTLGVDFTSAVAGGVTGIQIYDTAANTGPHTGQLWSSRGQLLGAVSIPDNGSSGWVTAAFATPVTIQAGQHYVLSYTAPKGRYAADQYVLQPTKPVVNRDLTAWKGVYRYGSGFPTQTWHASNYYVDPVFLPDGSSASTSPSPSPTTTATASTSPSTTSTPILGTPTTTATSTTSSPSTTSTPSTSTSPTTSSTPTATATATSTPSTGVFPDASTTGVPTGTQLSTYTGPCRITTANTVIDAKTVNCDLTVAAAGVVIRNSVINGTVGNDEASTGFGFLIQDSDVRVGNRAGTGIGSVGFTVLRVEVTGGNRSINCWRTCTVQDSYVHGQFIDSTGVTHESGIRMGSDGTITHNRIVCDAPDVPPDAGCSADLTGYGDFATVERNLIQNNLFMASTGGTCAYGGSSKGKPYSSGVNNVRFIGNVFEHGSGGKCGYWAPIMDFDSSAPGNVWSGNTWDDKTVLPSP